MKNIEKLLKSPQINQNIFYPRKTEIPEENQGLHVMRFTMKDGIKIGGIFHIVQKNAPSILFFHGNGEVAEDYAFSISDYFELGVNICIVDYRGYGFSEGSPTYFNLIKDTMQIYTQFVKYLKENDFNNEIIVFGRSLGSAPAAEIGLYNPPEVKGYIFESGFANTFDLLKYLFGIDIGYVSEKDKLEWNNAEKIARIKAPVLVIHGTDDNIVPTIQGKNIYESAINSRTRKMVLIRGATHNNIMMFKSEYNEAIKSIIEL